MIPSYRNKTESGSIWAIIFIILCSLDFFRPINADENILKIIYYITILACCIYGLFHAHKDREKTSSPMMFAGIYKLFFWEIALSIISAQINQNQRMDITLITSIRYFIFSFYFFLHFANYTTKKIEQAMNILSAIFIICFIAAFIAYPIQLFRGYGFSEEITTDRGFQRIRLTIMGGAPIYFSFFYAVNKLKEGKNYKWGISVVVIYIVILLQLGRLSILATTFLGTLLFLDQIKFYKKIPILLVFIFLITEYAGKIPIVGTLIQYTKDEREEQFENDNIRLLSFQFYTTEFNTNITSKIVGCGMYSLGNSDYGKAVDDARNMGLIPADVGYAFIYMIWGIAGIMLYLAILLKGLFTKLDKKNAYLKYYLIFLYMSSIAGNTLLGSIPFLCICCFMIDKLKIHGKN